MSTGGQTGEGSAGQLRVEGRVNHGAAASADGGEAPGGTGADAGVMGRGGGSSSSTDQPGDSRSSNCSAPTAQKNAHKATATSSKLSGTIHNRLSMSNLGEGNGLSNAQGVQYHPERTGRHADGREPGGTHPMAAAGTASKL